MDIINYYAKLFRLTDFNILFFYQYWLSISFSSSSKLHYELYLPKDSISQD